MNRSPKRKHSDAVDVPADNPQGTLARFTDGLRRVLFAPKTRMVTRHQERPDAAKPK